MWLGHENTELDCLADENWEWLKLELSLPIEGWIVKRLSRRDDPHISSITRFVRHKSKGCFTYKFQLRPQSAEGFEKHYRLQQIAFDTFPHSAEFTSPSPVFVDAERQISLMSFVEGQPVSEVMKQSRAPDEQFELLAKCGAWLDAFHRSQGHEIRKFRPEHTLNYYQKLREQIELGDCDVTARSLFLRGIDKLVEVAPHVAGFETVAAMQHGDFHLRNLILNNGQIAGIDFSKDHVAPVGYDIAKILLDFTTLTRSSDGLATGQIVHHDTYEAFFNGYRLVGPDDPGVRLLLYARILATLNTVPAKQKERTYAKQRTLERLRPIAINAFRRSDAIPTQASEKMIKFLLTKKSLNVARQGDHEFANAVKKALKPLGYKVTYRRNTPHNRDQLCPEDFTLVHMSAPVGRRGLVFRHAYNGPFWHLETRSARWDWEVARKRFAPEKINGTEAGNFFEKWRAKLVPNNGLKQENGDFIYMPLQGKLLRHRSFQQASPLEMIKATLQYTDLPIQATLHPSENYTDDEIDALEIIQSNENRFKVTNLQMHDALASCRFVVSENSSAAFHAVLYEKPSVLFAKIDFNHICFQFDPMKPEKVFQDVSRNRPRFQEYLFWYWSKNCINLDSDDACQDIVQRMSFLGWPLSKLQHE